MAGAGVIVLQMKNLLRAVFCVSLALVAGCSSYAKRFAAATDSDVKRQSLEGAYSGRWSSARNSAWGGNLRCILTKVSVADYRADFHATWHGFSSTHSVVLHTKPALRKGFEKGARDFAGTSALHTIIGAGTYSCMGTMGTRTMRACYDATYDKGTFEMTRVPLQSAAKAGAH